MALNAADTSGRGPFRVVTASRGCRCCRSDPPGGVENFRTEDLLRRRISEALMQENGDGWWADLPDEGDAAKHQRRSNQVTQINERTASIEQALEWVQQALEEDAEWAKQHHEEHLTTWMMVTEGDRVLLSMQQSSEFDEDESEEAEQ